MRDLLSEYWPLLLIPAFVLGGLMLIVFDVNRRAERDAQCVEAGYAKASAVDGVVLCWPHPVALVEGGE